MKKIYLLSAVLATLTLQAQTESWEGVPVLPNFYANKMSLDGNQIVGFPEEDATVYYNIAKDQFYYYPNCTYGRGYVVADNGWVVGLELLDSETKTNTGVVMTEGKIIQPDVFDPYVTSNIHSITPDGSRVCGVVGNPGHGASNLPYYCDIDANGNFGELQFLPTPEKDFFGNRPQYCSATWISADGKTIAGQVVEARGFFIYPIIYHQNEDGVWNYSCPSQKLFNQDNLPLPEPLDDFDVEYPDLEYPEPTNFMAENMIPVWEAAIYKWETNNFAEELDPNSHLEDYMTAQEIADYLAAVDTYNKAVEEYNIKNEQYWEGVFKIVDSSVFFVQNNMALSPNGKWLASAAEWEDLSQDLFDVPQLYYVPYLFNLETGEVKQIADNKDNLGVNQVLSNGDVLTVTPASSALPPRSWLYKNDQKELVSIYDYMKGLNPSYGEWYDNELSGDIPVAEDDKGGLIYEYATVTGLVAGSDDLSTLCGGVLGYAIDYDMYLTYIFIGLPPVAGVESLKADPSFNGVYNVYNLQGVKVISTKDESEINSLPRGLYIINGKKILK